MPERTRAAVAFVIVVACALSLRLPALDAVGLNPDESQYEAIAAHVVAAGGSEYDRPETIGGGFTIYRVLTELFGPYPTRAIRLLVLIVDVGCAALLLLIVGRVAGLAAGTVAALVSVHLAPAFEGQSANREWFVVLPVLLALALALPRLRGDDDRRASLVWFASGLLAGSALWFKVQALGLLVAVPAAIVFDAWRRRGARIAARRLALHLAGGLAAGLAYLAPIVLHDALGAYVEMVTAGWADYVRPADSPPAGTDGPWMLGRLVGGLHSRGLIVLALATALARLVARATWPGSRATVAFLALAAGAVWSISLGGRFFSHYYLMLVPAVAALLGLALGLALRDARGGTAVPLVAIGAYAVERIGSLVAAGGTDLLRRPAEAPLFLLGLVGLAAIAGSVALDPRRRSWSGLAALVLLELVLLVVPVQLGPRPRSVPHLPDGLAAAAAATRAAAGSDDATLFVWGWLPELHSLTRLTPASHHVTSQYLVGDFGPRGGARLAAEQARELVAELERRRPEVIVDAAARSWTMEAGGRPTRYALDRLPPFGLRELLDRDYRPVARVDGVVVYRRAGSADPS